MKFIIHSYVMLEKLNKSDVTDYFRIILKT